MVEEQLVRSSLTWERGFDPTGFDSLSALRSPSRRSRDWLEVGIVAPDGDLLDCPRESPTERPSFAVIIPVYQGADTVGEAISSVLSQTVIPDEIIVCDDGSTDGLNEALAPFSDRITVLRQVHRGVAAARNLGLFHAHSEFVIVSDADDIMLSQSIETLAAFAVARPDLDILAANGYLAKEGTIVATWCRSRDSKAMFPLGDQRMGIVNDNLLPGNAAIRRQRLVDIGGFDESIGVAEDYDASARLIFAGSRAGLVLEPLQIFRLRSTSLSHNEVASIDGRITVLTKLLGTHDLTSLEYSAARAKMAEYRSGLVRATAKLEAKAALIQARPDVRSRCFRVAMQKGHGFQARGKALMATLAPTWARRHAQL